MTDLKPLFFRELLDFQSLRSGPWCVCGDFNEILSLDEKTSGGGVTPGSILFVDFVDSQGLRDVAIVDGKFMWSHMQSSSMIIV